MFCEKFVAATVALEVLPFRLMAASSSVTNFKFASDSDENAAYSGQSIDNFDKLTSIMLSLFFFIL
jgi:hypothetical protein